MPVRHVCNTGGSDLPQARLDMVRLGILPLGVYPSKVCRRLPGLMPVMEVKARIVTLRQLRSGDFYGYGLRYQATGARRIAVVPIGYGDGYRGCATPLAVGSRAAGADCWGVAMDALAVDVTEIPQTGFLTK